MSITKPKGFVAASGSAGIKGPESTDFALVLSENAQPVPTAGVFTSNLAAAAPVQVSRKHLVETKGHIAGVVLTSGNANAATGEHGRAAALKICEEVANEVGVAREEILICQTGLIGIRFPIDTVLPAIAPIVGTRDSSRQAGLAAARAIMTTDSVEKEVLIEADGYCVAGMAKGAAMLSPSMATMLAVLTTDAEVDSLDLNELLREAVAVSFNSITVDGATSTNDTVILMASGRAGKKPHDSLRDSIVQACDSLAHQMVSDGEGATKVVHVRVTGAINDLEAQIAARKVASSLLVKCSLNGQDPYWGRIVSELGSAGVGFEMDKVSIAYGETTVCRQGVESVHDVRSVEEHLAQRHNMINCDLGLGNGQGVILTTDLSYDYITENRKTS